MWVTLCLWSKLSKLKLNQATSCSERTNNDLRHPDFIVLRLHSSYHHRVGCREAPWGLWKLVEKLWPDSWAGSTLNLYCPQIAFELSTPCGVAGRLGSPWGSNGFTLEKLWPDSWVGSTLNLVIMSRMWRADVMGAREFHRLEAPSVIHWQVSLSLEWRSRQPVALWEKLWVSRRARNSWHNYPVLSQTFIHPGKYFLPQKTESCCTFRFPVTAAPMLQPDGPP